MPRVKKWVYDRRLGYWIENTYGYMHAEDCGEFILVCVLPGARWEGHFHIVAFEGMISLTSGFYMMGREIRTLVV